MPDTDIGAVEVCHDCYFAHHYGATEIEREATAREQAAWLDGYDARYIKGLTFHETDHGLFVTEWFAGESDQRSEGGEPLAALPEYGHVSGDWRVTDITDFTCSNHDVTERLDWEADDWDETTACPHCGQTGWENGITEFTWRSCDGCESNLGGSRYRLAIHWERITEEATP